MSIIGIRAGGWVVAPLPCYLLFSWPPDASSLQLSLVLSLVSWDDLGNWPSGRLINLRISVSIFINLLPWICNFLSLHFLVLWETAFFPPCPFWLVLLASLTRSTTLTGALSLTRLGAMVISQHLLAISLGGCLRHCALNPDWLHTDLCLCYWTSAGCERGMCCSAYCFAFTIVFFAMSLVGWGGGPSLYILFTAHE